MNCRGKMDSKFSVDTGFICNKAPTTAAMLRDKIKNTLCISNVEL
jgi:hypothetical protein